MSTPDGQPDLRDHIIRQMRIEAGAREQLDQATDRMLMALDERRLRCASSSELARLKRILAKFNAKEWEWTS